MPVTPETMIDLVEGLMHARGAIQEGRDALAATKDVVKAIGLPEECNDALDSLNAKLDWVLKDIARHVMNVGKGTMTDDIRPILDFGNWGGNVT